MGHSVGEVAKLSGVTVRTLHHYDEIGLLVPTHRSDAGYRGYDDADLERLQRILFYRPTPRTTGSPSRRSRPRSSTTSSRR